MGAVGVFLLSFEADGVGVFTIVVLCPWPEVGYLGSLKLRAVQSVLQVKQRITQQILVLFNFLLIFHFYAPELFPQQQDLPLQLLVLLLQLKHRSLIRRIPPLLELQL